jgi:hypothetical protein
MKVCKRCNKEKIITEFSKDRRLKDGLSNLCEDCRIEFNMKMRDVMIKRYEDPLERLKTGLSIKKSYEEHPEYHEKLSISRKRRAKEHPVHICKDGLKYCPKCKQEKSKDGFYKNKRSYDGLQTWCIECTKESYLERTPNRKRKPTPHICKNENFKFCPKCQRELPKTEFWFDGRTKDNLSYKCKECGRKDLKINFLKNIKGKGTCEICGKPVYRGNTRCGDCARSDPKYIEKMKAKWERLVDDPNWYETVLIRATGEGYWYANPLLIKMNNGGFNHKNYYCEKWNKNLWVRIDAAYDYKSILSGKDKFDNNGRNLTHHHLYWQPKACCVWDEDVNGYYAWILNNKEWVKYYIKGDPNKFVLLTDKEHGMVRGKSGTTKDRIWWIQHIEDLIEQREKEGKKCYLTPEEYEVYKVEHADIIEKYKK